MNDGQVELQSLLDAIAENAALACGADDAMIQLADAGVLRRVAHFGPIPLTAPGTLPIDRHIYSGRAFLDGATLHVQDALAGTDPGLADARENARRAGYRTLLTTPLRPRQDPV